MLSLHPSPGRRFRRLVALGVAATVAVGACGGSSQEVALPFDDADAPSFDDAAVPEAGNAVVFTEQAAGDPEPLGGASDVPVATDDSASSTTLPLDAVTGTTLAPVATALPVTVPVTAAPPLTGWPAFDQQLESILADGSQAVSATVLRDGVVVHEVALGRRLSAAGSDPVEVGDRYRIASISKVITTIVVLRLVEQGFFGLDEPVGERLASKVGVGSSALVRSITVRQLLTHRSGIGQYENLMFRHEVNSCPEAGAVGLGRSLERSPGTTFRYSNLNFCLLGLLIEDATGRGYEDVVDEQLLAPLGITGMRLAGTFDVGDGDVEHESDAGRNYMEVLGGSGSWIASPTDVAMIIDSLDLATPGWKPLTAPTLAEMRAVTLDPPPDPSTIVPSTVDPATGSSVPVETMPAEPVIPTRGYGLGLMIFGEEAFGHTGTVESTHAMTARTRNGWTWAIMVSGDAPSSSRDLAGIIEEALRSGGFLDS